MSVFHVFKIVQIVPNRAKDHMYFEGWYGREAMKQNRRVYYEHVVSIAFNQDQLAHLKPLLENLNVLIVYQTNIYQYLNFTHKSDPVNIQYFKKRPNHGYPRYHSQSRFYLKSTL